MTPGSAPRLRSLELKWIQEGGEPRLFMRDPAGISPHAVAVPGWVAMLLGFCDGQHDISGIQAGFAQRTGQVIPREQVEGLLEQLDELLFLDSPNFTAARASLLDDFHAAPFRAPSHAGAVYPTDAEALVAALDGYRDGLNEPTDRPVRGIICPHIDYQRGGPVYAQTWDRAADAIQEVDLVVVFGTDHSGSAGSVTLTRQNYATPFGVLPTAVDVVDTLAQAIGPGAAFAEELHHRNEHSIELASVWLHAARRDNPPEVVPILCGSFYAFTEGEADPATFSRFEAILSALREATAGRKVLVVAAADLAHVGPAFGDTEPYGAAKREALEAADSRLLSAIVAGDAAGFFGQLREVHDCNRICGLPPIYLTLRFLEQARGEVVGYDQCPADPEDGSFVSIAGVLLE
ncbi:MAG TPA: AmmeMemoRadiSam system protein B [Chloroflexota bacterium]|nr:AmmeMemoRadiSam system protein B [Chloroflexota bacterium]